MHVTTIQYPLEVASIRPNWGPWEVIREIQQEFIDLSATDYRVSQKDGKTIWTGDTPQFELASLVLAKSFKRERKMDTIGRFGDGTVLSMAVALRLGWNPILYSHKLILRPRPVTIDIEGVPIEIMEVVVDENPSPLDHTRYEVDYDGHLYQERFIHRDTDPLSSHDCVTLYSGTGFFCKGVWVSDGALSNRPCLFRYNFDQLKLTEDRAIAESWDLEGKIRRFWEAEEDRALQEQLWTAIKDNSCGEATLWWGYAAPNEVTKAVVTQLWGDIAVGTDAYWQTQAQYLKGTVQSFNGGLTDFMKQIYPTDKQYAQQMGSAIGERAVKINTLTEQESKRYKLLQRLAQRIVAGTKLRVAVMEPNGLSNGRSITIAHHVLQKSDEEAVAVLIHELAHDQADVADATSAMVDSVARIGAQLVLSYSSRAA